MQIDRLITSLSVKNDSELARHLDKGRSVVGSWRARQQVPMPILKQVSEEKGVSLEWLLTGEGAMYRGVGLSQMQYNPNDVLSRMMGAYEVETGEQLAEKLDVNQREIRCWEKDGNKIGEKHFDKVVAETGATREYLETGKLNSLLNTQLINIPEYDLLLSAGGGSYPEGHLLAINSRTFSKQWLSNKGLQPDKLTLARVHGDSMEPLLRDKDMVMIDHSRIIPSDAMPFAVRIGEVLYIKLVQMRGKILRLVSVNKVYDPMEIDLADQGEDAEVIGAIVWHAHSWV